MTPRNVYSSLSGVIFPTAAKKTKTFKKQRIENVEKLLETAVECLKTPGGTSSSSEKSEDNIFAQLIPKKLKRIEDCAEI